MIIKRKKKLEIDESKIENVKLASSQSQAKIPENKIIEDNDEVQLKEENKPLTNRTQKEEQISQIKQNFKSKGGDPHGALQKIENEELEQLRMEQAQSRQSENVSYIDLFIISRIIEKAFHELKKMPIL